MPEVAPAAVDAHQHVWDPGRADYPWMTPALLRHVLVRYVARQLYRLLKANSCL